VFVLSKAEFDPAAFTRLILRPPQRCYVVRRRFLARRAVPEHRLDALLAHCRGLKPMLTGVVHPCSADALAGAVEAAAAGLIEPVLFAPEAELHEVASTAKLDLTGYRIVATDGAEDSALKAAMAAGSGEVRGLMKGSLHTDVLLHAVVQKEATATLPLHRSHLIALLSRALESRPRHYQGGLTRTWARRSTVTLSGLPSTIASRCTAHFSNASAFSSLYLWTS
jgi:hypothetical protein